MHETSLIPALLLLLGLAASGMVATPTVPSLSKKAGRPANQEAAATDPLGRNTPLSTIPGFAKGAQRGDFELAVRYLDTKQSGSSEKELARQLALILDRGFAGSLAMLGNETKVELKGSLPATRRVTGTVKTKSATLDIFLDLVQRGNNLPIWLFSSKTPGSKMHSERIPRLGGISKRTVIENNSLHRKIPRSFAARSFNTSGGICRCARETEGNEIRAELTEGAWGRSGGTLFIGIEGK